MSSGAPLSVGLPVSTGLPLSEGLPVSVFPPLSTAASGEGVLSPQPAMASDAAKVNAAARDMRCVAEGITAADCAPRESDAAQKGQARSATRTCRPQEGQGTSEAAIDHTSRSGT
ncbi:MAG: hypothetical protein R3A52_02895 [Polyangiales bacterium]